MVKDILIIFIKKMMETLSHQPIIIKKYNIKMLAWEDRSLLLFASGVEMWARKKVSHPSNKNMGTTIVWIIPKFVNLGIDQTD